MDGEKREQEWRTKVVRSGQQYKASSSHPAVGGQVKSISDYQCQKSESDHHKCKQRLQDRLLSHPMTARVQKWLWQKQPFGAVSQGCDRQKHCTLTHGCAWDTPTLPHFTCGWKVGTWPLSRAWVKVISPWPCNESQQKLMYCRVPADGEVLHHLATNFPTYFFDVLAQNKNYLLPSLYA